MKCRECASSVAFDEQRIALLGAFVCGECKLLLLATR